MNTDDSAYPVAKYPVRVKDVPLLTTAVSFYLTIRKKLTIQTGQWLRNADHSEKIFGYKGLTLSAMSSGNSFPFGISPCMTPDII